MSGYARVVIAAVFIAMCICWIGCGGSTNPPCQAATCVSSAGKFLYITALDDVSGFLVFSSSAIYSQGDGSGNVKILNERIKRTSTDKVRFRVKLTNESRSAIFVIGITYQTP